MKDLELLSDEQMTKDTEHNRKKCSMKYSQLEILIWTENEEDFDLWIHQEHDGHQRTADQHTQSSGLC